MKESSGTEILTNPLILFSFRDFDHTKIASPNRVYFFLKLKKKNGSDIKLRQTAHQ
jgi:hypothetical protein